MARGPKKHLKRLNAPKHWMLDKLTGRFAPRPSTGPHKLRDSLPLVILLRQRLKYALTYKEASMILMERHVQVDGKARTDITFPAGFMDVVSIPATDKYYRMLYDVKGRYVPLPISKDEAKFKLGRVVKSCLGPGGVPYIVTHDGKTMRYPNPDTKVYDTVKIDLETMRPTELLKFEIGAQVYCNSGRNKGRIGILVARDRHPGMFDIVHVKDLAGNTFATRLKNIFVVGKGGKSKALIKLPKGNGVKLSISEERDRRHAERAKAASA
jgi:small subunit ribosomal protein S4e